MKQSTSPPNGEAPRGAQATLDYLPTNAPTQVANEKEFRTLQAIGALGGFEVFRLTCDASEFVVAKWGLSTTVRGLADLRAFLDAARIAHPPRGIIE